MTDIPKRWTRNVLKVMVPPQGLPEATKTLRGLYGTA